MTALNANVDTDLNLLNPHGLNAYFIHMMGTILDRDNFNSFLNISGGSDAILGSGAYISLYGRTGGGAGLTGGMRLRVVNAAGDDLVEVMRVTGVTDTPVVDWNARRLTNILPATTANDALTYNAWTTWNPTLVWGGAAPASLTTVARWVKIGKTVYFDFFCLSTDSNACSSLTISLPVAPLNVAMRIACAAHEQYGVAGATYKPLSAFILADGADNLIHFWDFATATDGQAIAVSTSGFYEVA